MKLQELQQGLAIDKSILDDEVIRQPVLFYTVSEELTEAVAERDAAKEELALVDADLNYEYRSKLGGGSEKRITDTVVSSHVIRDPRHSDAYHDWLDKKTYADKLLALKEAFQQRSYMLRDLVSLYSANYYETTSMKPSKAQDVAHYNTNRARLGAARVARKA